MTRSPYLIINFNSPNPGNVIVVLVSIVASIPKIITNIKLHTNHRNIYIYSPIEVKLSKFYYIINIKFNYKKNMHYYNIVRLNLSHVIVSLVRFASVCVLCCVTCMLYLY